MPEPIIHLVDVAKSFGKKEVLKDIDLDIYENEIFALIGVSGAGKSTLLRSLIGFYKLDAGTISFYGNDVSKNNMMIRKYVGVSTQEGCFYETLSVIENLKYFGGLYGLSRKAIIENTERVLNEVQLIKDKETQAKDLSGGMKRRLDIACALIHNPPVLVLDEPTAGLDPVLRAHMWKLIKKLNEKGRTIIISSHLLGEVEKICDRVGIISAGKILDIGSPNDLQNKYANDEEVILETFPGDYQEILEKLKQKQLPISSFTYKEHQLVIYTSGAEEIIKALIDIIKSLKEKLIDISVNRPNLSQVFQVLTRGKEVGDELKEVRTSVQEAYLNGYTKQEIRVMLDERNWKESDIEKILGELP